MNICAFVGVLLN